MQFTNLNFTPREEAVLLEQEFFVIRQSVIQKLKESFGLLEVAMKNSFKGLNIDLENVNASSGKIYRGENYNGFPYMVLDCPRLFSTSSVFAFRTMYWWGHEFSFTLHLQGVALEAHRRVLLSNLPSAHNKDCYVCVNSTPWQYHFQKDNYILLPNADYSALTEMPFFKISRRLDAKNYSSLHEYAMESFVLLMNLLKS